MYRIGLLTLAALMAISCLAYLRSTEASRRWVVDKEVHDYVGGAGKAIPLDQVDHSSWSRLLQKYVDADGMVNYAAWKKSDIDRAALRHYLARLSEAAPQARTSREGKLAFWINAYNAQTIYGILEVYPTSSIRNHTAAIVGYNIWKDLVLPVDGQNVSLDDIEHRILRKLREPRIHFAIVCASISCPRLLNQAYLPEQLESQLASNSRDFFTRSKNLQVDIAKRRLRVSSILKWFGDDFGSTPQEALARVAEYMPDQDTKELVAGRHFTVSYLDYDWSLNEQ